MVRYEWSVMNGSVLNGNQKFDPNYGHDVYDVTQKL